MYLFTNNDIFFKMKIIGGIGGILIFKFRKMVNFRTQKRDLLHYVYDERPGMVLKIVSIFQLFMIISTITTKQSENLISCLQYVFARNHDLVKNVLI